MITIIDLIVIGLLSISILFGVKVLIIMLLLALIYYGKSFIHFFINLFHGCPFLLDLHYCREGFIKFFAVFIVLIIVLNTKRGKAFLENIKVKLKITTKEDNKMATNNSEVNLRAQNQYKKLIAEYTVDGSRLTEEDQAKLFARAIETQMLKAPSSAKWPDLSDIVVTTGDDNTFKVLGYCEAQNANGVYLREEYTFNLRINENKEWETVDQFISTADAVRQQTQKDIEAIDKGINNRAIQYFIIISVLGLLFWIIEMAIAGI